MIFVFSLTCLEIEGRQQYTLAPQQTPHILIEQGNIQPFNALKILFPELIQRNHIPVQIVIIQWNRMRIHPQCPQLRRQTMGKGGLPR